VTSPAFLGNHKAEREAGVLESLHRMPAAGRPPYLITTPTARSGHPIFEHLIEPPPLFQTSSLSDEIQIFRARYDALEHGDEPYRLETRAAIAGLAEVDRLNVCDTEDERGHGYHFRSRLGNLRLHGTARSADEVIDGRAVPVLDAGRAILGEEEFDVHALPGKPLTMVLRSAREIDVNVLRAVGSGRFHLELDQAWLRVEIGGRTAASDTWRPRLGWDERVLRLPADQVGATPVRLRVVGHYAAFRYWFYQ
jgi:hypothetical protein